ncbi:transcriptional regulator with XRE-family HTH domain [Variovorax boronicumulans]|uniref:Transcriptional regulator with XRE-family HTH domain n=1 Tax=Variovorax boronicumulans TaxID=436515 RepID=A0AAW8DVF0_9BURK|nr:helix-turn-helix transcriptional regulator [Variovorax boronicumulans]MDP9878021.1 transcriptional regulator with XRE-family HTH domain [Variovorax boronicumulans]MDP9923304.1 transcriptional regulator with XRE-family HTH domain [Variovorax boronicumulans]
MATTPKRRKRTVPDAAPEVPLLSLARQVRGWTDTLLGVAGSASDIGMTLAQARIGDPTKKAALSKVGSQLRTWREEAGLTASELSDAVGLGDSHLIEQAEGGVATLPFDIVLRLAGVLGRRDPLPIAMGLTRQYNPELWKALEAFGIGRLAVQGTRERELANVYRGNDAARELDDEHFAQVLAFTKQAFDMAVAFSHRPDHATAEDGAGENLR